MVMRVLLLLAWCSAIFGSSFTVVGGEEFVPGSASRVLSDEARNAKVEDCLGLDQERLFAQRLLNTDLSIFGKEFGKSGAVVARGSCKSEGVPETEFPVLESFSADDRMIELQNAFDAKWNYEHASKRPQKEQPRHKNRDEQQMLRDGQFQTRQEILNTEWTLERLDPLAAEHGATVSLLVNDTSRVAVFDDFLSSGEVDYLLKLKERNIHDPSDKYQKNSDKYLQIRHPIRDLNFTLERFTGIWEDPIVDRIQERLAKYIGGPAFVDGELGIQMTEYGPVGLDSKGWDPQNIHHDLVYSSARFATLIVYLNDMPVNAGGCTMFPGLGKQLDVYYKTPGGTLKKMPMAEVLARKSKMILSRRNERGKEFLVDFQHGATDVLESLIYRGVSDMCREKVVDPQGAPPTGPDARGLMVQPKKGQGLIFWSRLRNGVVDPLTWHVGCGVHKGVKHIAQEFKQFSTWAPGKGELRPDQ
jgi:hypothetical protein